MKKEKKLEKKLSLKKMQITKLSLIRGGDGNDNATNGDTTTSKNCDNDGTNRPKNLTVSIQV
ncbi:MULTISPECIES: hypothetical protein [Chryseobacterium]|uniref:Uncharacterized protein n=1 Tax=Chryseobacterium taihuense TaxID=1141221 RepID=A0A4U8WF63_9FLAO|nr:MULTISPECIES: hypothetical protein [Chryseobacterium]QQV02410.1 hypothetical protein I6I61_15300 [Chryseobacterium sp. FDAARGOS 1104]VFB04336.1 Uncharacterised protein [Chryseobacterium taihuense]